MFQRFDRSVRLARVDATPQGGLAAGANLTRVGVFTYTKADGTRVRELRHPDEVFKPESLATLKGAPLTIGHPGMVTPDRYRELNVGHVADDVRRDDRFVAATVRIQDAAAVAAVKAGDLVEVSCGYTADVVPETGVFNGEEYDAVQRNVRYNHAALLPAGGGRAGREVALKLDANDAIEQVDAIEDADDADPIVRAAIALNGRGYAAQVRRDRAPFVARVAPFVARVEDSDDPIEAARARMNARGTRWDADAHRPAVAQNADAGEGLDPIEAARARMNARGAR